jgi:hypothetical protein
MGDMVKTPGRVSAEFTFSDMQPPWSAWSGGVLESWIVGIFIENQKLFFY